MQLRQQLGNNWFVGLQFCDRSILYTIKILLHYEGWSRNSRKSVAISLLMIRFHSFFHNVKIYYFCNAQKNMNAQILQLSFLSFPRQRHRRHHGPIFGKCRYTFLNITAFYSSCVIRTCTKIPVIISPIYGMTSIINSRCLMFTCLI